MLLLAKLYYMGKYWFLAGCRQDWRLKDLRIIPLYVKKNFSEMDLNKDWFLTVVSDKPRKIMIVITDGHMTSYRNIELDEHTSIAKAVTDWFQKHATMTYDHQLTHIVWINPWDSNIHETENTFWIMHPPKDKECLRQIVAKSV